MTTDRDYLFKSKRLGFRNWLDDDIIKMAEINADPEVMKYFPSVYSFDETRAFIERMQRLFAEKGFCYFAVDRLDANSFIGFIGLAEQNYEADFTPCIDIGWRLKRSEWNNGFATEGAMCCLEFAFEMLKLEKVVATAPVVNTKSEQVMKKAGMRKVKTFFHTKLLNYEALKECVLYEKWR